MSEQTTKQLLSEDYLELIPAYGRDYKSEKDVERDFRSGKDFEQTALTRNGTYCSIRDFAPGTKVLLRYEKLTMITQVIV